VLMLPVPVCLFETSCKLPLSLLEPIFTGLEVSGDENVTHLSEKCVY
jgi:hypothetical protein